MLNLLEAFEPYSFHLYYQFCFHSNLNILDFYFSKIIMKFFYKNENMQFNYYSFLLLGGQLLFDRYLLVRYHYTSNLNVLNYYFPILF